MAQRNSRVYAEDAIFFEDSSYTSSTDRSSSSGSSYHSRRSSRSSFREEIYQCAPEMEEGLRNGAPIKEALRYQSSITGARDFTLEKSGMQPAVSLPKSSSPNMDPTAKLPTLLPTIHQSVEYPVVPLDGRPLNFGVVVPGFYRSSYPKQHDFDFIKSLKLKTIVTLVKKDEFQDDLAAFADVNGIRQVTFDMKGTKKEAIPLDTMADILQLTLDKRNYPLLVHCNHGKHRTGCVVAAARRVAGWEVDPALEEYRAFASPKTRDCDIDYINAFQSSLIPRFEDDIVPHKPVQVKTFRLAANTLDARWWRAEAVLSLNLITVEEFSRAVSNKSQCVIQPSAVDVGEGSPTTLLPPQPTDHNSS
ncbi:tyrosine phosphatase [Cordyceps militaris CM01]|uniref:diphosphoinositol-polyphosphate diphosphatase n=1 Tax=Cordyceps militaris (strain CM01) TaxID=983644 RepID=G3J848_CORMM|nr:tyrosine phosphatase [Cordyceps militaris CM01]EGX93890.1 tyrosine phosphatase [Cordyceps militaris CM01]